MEEVRIVNCDKCGEEIELIPPIDLDYCIAKDEEPETKDYKEKIYECPTGHQVIVYWTRKDYKSFVVSAGVDVEKELDTEY